MDYTIVVSATASELAPLQYIAPYSGCAMGGVLHARTARTCSSSTTTSVSTPPRTVPFLFSSAVRPDVKRIPATCSICTPVFSSVRRVWRRNLAADLLTALPIIETQAGDVSAYIPTNVISITDGQIFLETELFHSGVMPAVNPGISVSRVGGSAQIKAMKKVAGKLKLLYSQYRELQSFAQFGSDLDKDTRDRLEQGARIVEVLKQDRNAPVDVAYQVCILYAVIGSYLKDVPVERIREFELELYPWMEANAADVLTAIRETKDLSKETEALLNKAITTRVAEFLQNQ